MRHPDPAKRLQGVLIALDPRTGGIRALVGGRDYWLSQFNRASQAHRQPGSTFKPFVYLAALRGGPRGEPPRLTASSLVEDGPVTVDLGPETWTLHNRRGFFLGPVTVRQALQISLNAPAVRTAQMLGLDAVIRTARDVGFTSPFPPHLALALGGVEVVPLELAAAYATLANSGTRVVPTTIEAIADGNGMLASEARQLTRRVIQPEEAFVLNNMLVGVMQSGTGAMAKVRGVEGEVAGKTGSTRRDAWLVGYTPRLVTLVWIGFDGGDPIRLTGARGALPMWVDFMRSAMTIVPSPKGVTRLSGYAFADFADHLTCYDVKPSEAAPKVVVRLFDQFFPTGQNAEVRQLRLLCTPAIKLK